MNDFVEALEGCGQYSYDDIKNNSFLMGIGECYAYFKPLISHTLIDIGTTENNIRNLKAILDNIKANFIKE